MKGALLELPLILSVVPTNEEIEKKLAIYNARTAPFGLTLSKEDLTEIVARQRETLKELQRIEFGSGPLENIITTFCDSPYLSPDSLSDTLGSLQEIFYELKDASNNEIPDDDLIDAMRLIFDTEAHGSLEYFAEIPLDTVKKAIDRANQDNDEDWSEYDTQKEHAIDEAPEESRDALTRVTDAETLERPTNEYAAGFYDEQFELYRTAFDFNSRIGGSSL